MARLNVHSALPTLYSVSVLRTRLHLRAEQKYHPPLFFSFFFFFWLENAGISPVNLSAYLPRATPDVEL